MAAATATPGRGTGLRQLLSRVVDGESSAVARLITLVESESPAAPEAMTLLAEHPGRAQVVGITGSPGVGKSTSTSALIASYRRRGLRVGALVVDPSSPLSGGALLGDRLRMGEHSGDGDVFVRSMASRGRLGGLSWSAPQTVRVMSAAGCDVVLIETVGVGQAEVDIAALADTTIVLLAPGAGDSVQAAKAGVLEIADVFVVNKADRDGARTVVRDIRQAVAARRRTTDASSWRPPILETVALRGDGADDVAEAVLQHQEWLTASGLGEQGRLRRAAHEVEALLRATVDRRLAELLDGGAVDQVSAGVLAGEVDPYAAAARLARGLFVEEPRPGPGVSATH